MTFTKQKTVASKGVWLLRALDCIYATSLASSHIGPVFIQQYGSIHLLLLMQW